MIPVAYAALHVIGATIGYFLLRAGWLREWNYTRADRRFTVVLAMLTGPVAPAVAFMAWGVHVSENARRADDVLARRRR